MNRNILLAFFGGALLASGIVYMAVKPEAKPVARTLYVDNPATKPAAAQPQAPAAAPEQQQPAAEPKSPVVSEVTEPAPPPRRHAHSYAAEPRHARREAPVAAPRQMAEVKPPAPKPAATPVASVTPPMPVTAPAPAPAPVVADPAPAPPVAAAPEPTRPELPKVEPPQPHRVTLAAGTPLNVRLGETLSTQRNRPGDTFIATLDQPLIVDGFVIAERGARCEGRVVESDPGGRVRGVAHLELELTSVHTSDGQRVRIHTTGFGKDADTNRRSDAAKVGGGAALGAIIGAIAGGGKGAAIGAGVGGAAGAGDVAMTRGKAAEVRVESRLSFRVQDPVTITEKLD
jgi:hypothetical protein